MEWMLQVVDEFDDVVAAARQRLLGLSAEIGLMRRARRNDRTGVAGARRREASRPLG